MEPGAEPYDPQVPYNVFADHDAREGPRGATPLRCAVWGDHAPAAARLAPPRRDVWSLSAIGDVARLRDVLHEDPSRALDYHARDAADVAPDDEAAAREIAAPLRAAPAS